MDRMVATALAASLFLSLASIVGASAQDGPRPGEDAAGQPEGDWLVQIGGVAIYGPEYEGSEDYEFAGFPLLEIEYKERFFLSPFRGAGIFLVNDDVFQLGTAISYGFGRDEDDSSDFAGLGDIDGGATILVNAEYNLVEQQILRGLSFGAQFDHQFTGDDTGFIFSADVGYFYVVTEQLFLRPSINAAYASGEYMDAFFGVSASQSARSGLTQYNPSSGIKSVGGTLGMFYEFDRHWDAQAFLMYGRLLGDAADSPIVKDENQYQAALGLTYTF